MPEEPSPPRDKSLPHIVVVDDEPDVRALLERYLGGQGLRVTAVADGAALHARVAAEPVDLVLLDLGLPGEDGLDVLRTLRRAWHGAVIILSGRGEAVERIVGLEIGADDYVTKPFDLRELLARIRSVLRRAAPAAAVAAPAAPAAPGPLAGPGPAAPPSGPGSPVERALLFAGFRLEPGARRLVDGSGSEVALTTGEFDLLLALARAGQRVLSRDALMNALHGRDAGPYDRAIDAQVVRLRRKLGDPADRPALIKSVRGAGYLLAVDVQRA